jgi:pimeloyl-ACP methyl ester carboxylesterase
MSRSWISLAAVVVTAGCGGNSRPATTGSGDTAGGTVTAPSDGAPAGTPAPEDVSFVTEDGVTLVGTYYPPADPAEHTGCALFVHQLSSTRAEWQPVIARLRGRAHLMTIDMRGHGGSTQATAGALSWKTFETGDWERVERDVAQAVDELIEKGTDSTCVLVGASIGSSAVLRYAGAHPDRVRALVLLSPGIAYRGLRTPDAARNVHAPVMIVHSQENGAVDAAGALAGIWRDAGVAVEVLADPGQAHGMKILNGNADALDRVVRFLAGEEG